uniref:UPAR/Ly6 domain-containing protein n=1 Tax=Sparus aurata TaxID=8175 RepID=A0A671TNJ7_SPAAU
MYSSALGITTCVTLLLCVFHAACGLRCYTCETTDPKACTEIETCPPVWDSCSTLVLGSVIAKGCFDSSACQPPLQCCQRDLCNGAV